jgi:putative spermidine/putrescine transport system permease protein
VLPSIKEGGWLADYRFSSLPTTSGRRYGPRSKSRCRDAINVGFALPSRADARKVTYQRWVTTILVVPITLGTVAIAEGMLIYFGPKGWLCGSAVFPSPRRPIRLTRAGAC